MADPILVTAQPDDKLHIDIFRKFTNEIVCCDLMRMNNSLAFYGSQLIATSRSSFCVHDCRLHTYHVRETSAEIKHVLS